MLSLYYKLKLRVYLNRKKGEPPEERYGKLTGYILLWFLVSLLGYVALKILFAGNMKNISAGLLVYFLFVTVINIGDNFKKIYASLFERADKNMLYMFPMHNRHIISINMLDETIEYLKTYMLLVFPVFFSLVFFDKSNIRIVFLLIFGCICFSFAVVGLMTILLLITLNITKGKNIKTTSLILTLAFSGVATLLVFSDKYLKIIESKWIIDTLFMPIGYVGKSLNILCGQHINILSNIFSILVYTLLVLSIYYVVFFITINKGLLLIDAEYIVNIPFSRQLANLLTRKRQRKQSNYLSGKDIIGVFSGFDVIKMFASVTIMSILVYRYMMSGFATMYLGYFFMIKSMFVVIQLMHYIYQYEFRNLALVFSMCDNVSIMSSKRSTCIKVSLPFCLLLDICFLLFSGANLYISLCCLMFEVVFIVVLSWNCSYNVIQFSKIENYNIGFKIKGWIAYIENIILIQAPLILGYWIISTYDYNCLGLIRYLIVVCFTLCIIMISVFTIKRKSRRIYKNVIEFL